MISLISKLGVTGGAVSAVVLINPVRDDLNIAKPERKIEETENKEFSTIEDVELFERKNQCSFVYISAWADKVLYDIRRIIEKHKNSISNLEKDAIKAADVAKANCQRDKGLITLVNNNGWKQEEPNGGWGA